MDIYTPGISYIPSIVYNTFRNNRVLGIHLANGREYYAVSARTSPKSSWFVIRPRQDHDFKFMCMKCLKPLKHKLRKIPKHVYLVDARAKPVPCKSADITSQSVSHLYWPNACSGCEQNLTKLSLAPFHCDTCKILVSYLPHGDLPRDKRFKIIAGNTYHTPRCRNCTPGTGPHQIREYLEFLESVGGKQHAALVKES